MKDKEYTHIYLGRKIDTGPNWEWDPDQRIESHVVVEMPIRIPAGTSGSSEEQDFLVDWIYNKFPNWEPLAYCTIEQMP